MHEICPLCGETLTPSNQEYDEAVRCILLQCGTCELPYKLWPRVRALVEIEAAVARYGAAMANGSNRGAHEPQTEELLAAERDVKRLAVELAGGE
jgi:hypothetical protein